MKQKAGKKHGCRQTILRLHNDQHHNTVIYTGVTNHLQCRVYEHKNDLGRIFAKKYSICKLLYYEVTDNIYAALVREKQIKGGSRKKKIDFVNGHNPDWKDLYQEILG